MYRQKYKKMLFLVKFIIKVVSMKLGSLIANRIQKQN